MPAGHANRIIGLVRLHGLVWICRQSLRRKQGVRITNSFAFHLTRVVALTFAAPLVWALDISGASTVQPVVERLIPLFTQHGGEAVQLAGGGSGAGVKNTLAGTSQIGMVSRELKASEQTELKNTVIAMDALAIIVNQDNPLTQLTKSQLIELYTGKITNWSALGGPDLAVVRVTKEVGRSTIELFEHFTGLQSPDREQTDKPLITKDAYVIGSNLESLTLVGGLPGAIGYVSVGTARAMAEAGLPVKVLTLDGVEPSDAAIRERRYPIVRPLNLVYREATPTVAAFLALALSGEGQAVVKSLGFLPVGDR
jgi:phosphate transport system substrate-binding protein